MLWVGMYIVDLHRSKQYAPSCPLSCSSIRSRPAGPNHIQETTHSWHRNWLCRIEGKGCSAVRCTYNDVSAIVWENGREKFLSSSDTDQLLVRGQ